MKRLQDFNVKGKRILLRCDFNVPLSATGEVADDFRIQAALPTLQYALEKGAKLILVSHLGDPAGKETKNLSLDKIQEKLMEYLDISVTKAPGVVGKEILEWTKQMQEGEILLLENVRFHPGEEQNAESFAKELALLGDLFINDAFGVVHRGHASVVGVPRFLESGAGLLLQKEVAGLEQLFKNPKRPMVAVIGGAKIESKLATIDNISAFADTVLLGGLLANEIQAKGIKLQHPEKVVVPLDGSPGNGQELDIGPKTRELYEGKIEGAKTIFWSGPLGKYEDSEYAVGSLAVADAILEEASYAVAGGGNLLDLLGRYNLRDKFDHLSTGGSSMLAFLAGHQLPGLKALGYYD